MAQLTETEIRRKLRKGGKGTVTSGPSAIRSGDSWVYADAVIYLAYASSISNIAGDGTIPNQSDADDFQYAPFDSSGALLTWRGHLFSTSVYASGDATDYIWEDVSGQTGSTAFERYYTESSELLVNLGDPDGPGAGVTWVSFQ